MAELVPIPSPGIPLNFGDIGAPLVIVLHDKYGRLPWLEPYAAALANRGGLRVLVPDFYDGYATTDADDARALMTALSNEEAARHPECGDRQRARRGHGCAAGRAGRILDGRAHRPARRAGRATRMPWSPTTRPWVADDPGIVPCPVLLHLAEEDSWRRRCRPRDLRHATARQRNPGDAHTYVGTGALVRERHPAREGRRARCCAGIRPHHRLLGVSPHGLNRSGRFPGRRATLVPCRFNSDVVDAVLAHMNDDHRDDNVLIVRAFAGRARRHRGHERPRRPRRHLALHVRGRRARAALPWSSSEITERPEIRREIVVLYDAACEQLGVEPRPH